MIRNQRIIDPLDPNSKKEYLIAKNKYFAAIKKAKRDHWNSFLEREEPQAIFKAMAYTKENREGNLPPIQGKTTFKEKASILRTTLFPPPP